MSGDHPSNYEGPRYEVVARRYRPQLFEELIGQQQVTRALGNAIATNRVGHAYLFTGARGVGKTSAARIFAKALNCVSGPTATPCNKCDACGAIATGDDVDVLEIDGASNRGIDEIRQLRSNVAVRPSRSRFKIYVIDEVHMLTKEAFNALLKTLEEPPEHVKFIFCTTDPEKIPITVLSRCQRFDFAPVETAEILNRLREITVAEGATAEDEALELIARRAAGSMRDSQSLLEQLLAFAGKQVAVDDVHAMLGTARSSQIQQIVAELGNRNSAAALAALDAAIAEGVDVGQLIEQLLGHMRDLMVMAVDGSTELLLHNSRSDASSLAETAKRWGIESMLAAMQILDQTMVRLRQSLHARVLAEMALVRIANLEDLDDLAHIISQLQDGTAAPAAGVKKKPQVAIKANSAAATPSPRPSLDTSAGETASAGITAAATATLPRPATQVEAADPDQPQVDSTQIETMELTLANVAAFWQRLTDQIEGILADYLHQCTTVELVDEFKIIATVSESHLFYCDRADKRDLIGRLAQQLAGRRVQVEFRSDLKKVDEAAAPPTKRVSNRELIRLSYANEMVRHTVDLFDAEVLRVSQRGNRSSGD